MQKEVETRLINSASQNLRVETMEDGRQRVSGLAIPYNQPSEDLGGFREVFSPGAFADSLASGKDVLADVEHDSNRKLGRKKNGTLELNETPEGVYATITLPKTTIGTDAAEEVRTGMLDGMSIVFEKNPVQEWSGRGETTTRTIKKATLKGVTLTNVPAYRQTVGTVTLRSLEEHQKQQESDQEADKHELDQTPIAALRERLDLSEGLVE